MKGGKRGKARGRDVVSEVGGEEMKAADILRRGDAEHCLVMISTVEFGRKHLP